MAEVIINLLTAVRSVFAIFGEDDATLIDEDGTEILDEDAP